MTQQKKLKRAIRARARKTGESYTAARRHIVQAGRKTVVRPPPARPAAPSPRAGTPARPRSGEAGVIRKTGHGYDHWFAVLDAFGAPAKGHTASAAHLSRDARRARLALADDHRRVRARARPARAGTSPPRATSRSTSRRWSPSPLAEVVDALRQPAPAFRLVEGGRPSTRGAPCEAALAGPEARKFKVTGRQAGHACATPGTAAASRSTSRASERTDQRRRQHDEARGARRGRGAPGAVEDGARRVEGSPDVLSGARLDIAHDRAAVSRSRPPTASAFNVRMLPSVAVFQLAPGRVERDRLNSTCSGTS